MARRSRTQKVRRSVTNSSLKNSRRARRSRKQSGGEFSPFSLKGVMALFGHKPAAPAPTNQTLSVVNPMAAPAPVINAEAEARRFAALSKIQSKVGNYIKSNQARNNAAYRNSKGIPPVEHTDPLDEEEEEEELARLSQGDGGLTKAQIEEAVNNI